MKYLLLVALSLTACASAVHSVPPAFGFHGKVKPHREVVCLIDDAMTHERCEAVVRAVNKINEAVGYELLQLPSEVPLADVKRYTGHDDVTLVGVDTLQPGVLGITAYKLTGVEGGWLHVQLIVFDPQIWRDPMAADAVLLHELTHNLGAGHADQDSAWDSVMRPAWRPSAPINFTAADLTAIRAAYGR